MHRLEGESILVNFEKRKKEQREWKRVREMGDKVKIVAGCQLRLL